MTTTENRVDLLDDLKALIVDGAKEDDRSQQTDIGPSEVGHPCLRHLTYKMLGAPRCNEYSDPLPSVVGTGAHSRFEIFAHRANKRLGRTRWLPEFKVTVRQGLSGTCDLVDLDTMTAVDHKLPGTSRMATYTSKGPSPIYRTQAHLYGRGLRNAGIPIERVAIAFWPRGGQIKNAHLWDETYSDQVVDDALARLDMATTLIWDLDLGEKPDSISTVPATTGECFLCPWHARTPLTPYECNGT